MAVDAIQIVSLAVHTNLPSRLADPPAGVFGDGDGWHVGASMCFLSDTSEKSVVDKLEGARA